MDYKQETSMIEKTNGSDIGLEDAAPLPHANADSAQAIPSYTAKEEKSVLRKLDLWILPVLCFMNMTSFLDKANIGNANTAGLSKDLGLTNSQYTWLLTAFYIVYALSQWQMILLKVFKPNYVLGAFVLAYAISAISQGATKSFGGMMACRVLIALFEAGAGPAVALYFSMMYTRREYGLRWSIFQSTSCIANAFAGAAAYGLVQADTAVKPWQLLFLVESTPTFLAAALIFIIVPAAPDACRFLNERENEICKERHERGTVVETDKRINIRHFFVSLMEPWTWYVSVIHFCGSTAFNSISVFLSAIISEMGYGSLDAQGYSAPPYLVAYVFAIACAVTSDRINRRGIFVACGGLVGATGYLLVAYAPSTGVRYFGTYLVCIGVYVGQPLMYSWCANNAQSDSKRAAALVLFSLTGQCGSILGANIYPSSDKPRYAKGNTICAGALFLSATLSTIGTIWLARRNRQKDEQHGVPPRDMALAAQADGSDHPYWRFTL